MEFLGKIITIIIHSTHYMYLLTDWPKAYSEFSKSASLKASTSSTCRLYNNHVKFTKGSRVITGDHVIYDCGA